MPNFAIHYHPLFFKDLDRLTKTQLDAVNKRIQKIKENPEQFKDLKGGNNCYKVRIENMRLVYYFDYSNLWFLILENRSHVYDDYLKRLYNLKMKLSTSP